MRLKNNLFFLLLFLCILTLGFLIRIYLIYKIAIYPDDINFYNISLFNRFGGIITLKYWAVDYPQGYFLITRLLILLSPNLLFLKVANLIFYIISSVLLFKLGRRLFKNQLISLFPFALFSSSQFLMVTDIALNPYALSLTLSIALVYVFISLVDRFSFKKAVLFAFLIIFSTFISYALFLIIFALFIYSFFSIWKYPSSKKRYLTIVVILLISIIPTLIQLFLIIPLFPALSPHPSSLIDAMRSYIYSNLRQIMILPVIDFIFPVFILVFLPKQKFARMDTAKIYLLSLSIFISSIISFVIMEQLDLNISTRLFFAFHLGIILLLSILASKNNLIKLLVTYFILISFLANYHYALEVKTNKHLFQTIAKQMLVQCSDPQTFFIIDSSNYYFYPLYHYYIPFSPYKTKTRYKCVLGHTSVFDTNIRKPLLNLPKSKMSSYYFINLDQTDSMVKKFINLCQASVCYIFNPRLEEFEKIYYNSGFNLKYEYNINHINS